MNIFTDTTVGPFKQSLSKLKPVVTDVQMVLGCPRWFSFTRVLLITSDSTPKSEMNKGKRRPDVLNEFMPVCLLALGLFCVATGTLLFPD